MHHQELKARQRRERETHSPSTALRVHRALSWLGRAEQLAEDPDTQFVLLWIAFNAAYARDIDDGLHRSERLTFKDFLDELIGLDDKRCIENLVWTEFPGNIRVLLDNVYIFNEFWLHQSGRLAAADWKRIFSNANRAAVRALGRRDTTSVLSVVLSRLYVLRNQLVHGGATWSGSVNRAQVRDGANLLAKLVPCVITIMLDHPNHDWGMACYPVIE
jgi:hypothetical protein